MGVYYNVVNPAKKQFLEPAPFLDAEKFTPVLECGYIIKALKYLISDMSISWATFQGAWVATAPRAVPARSPLRGPTGSSQGQKPRADHPWRRGSLSSSSGSSFAAVGLAGTLS